MGEKPEEIVKEYITQNKIIPLETWLSRIIKQNNEGNYIGVVETLMKIRGLTNITPFEQDVFDSVTKPQHKPKE